MAAAVAAAAAAANPAFRSNHDANDTMKERIFTSAPFLS